MKREYTAAARANLEDYFGRPVMSEGIEHPLLNAPLATMKGRLQLYRFVASFGASHAVLAQLFVPLPACCKPVLCPLVTEALSKDPNMPMTLAKMSCIGQVSGVRRSRRFFVFTPLAACSPIGIHV